MDGGAKEGEGGGGGGGEGTQAGGQGETEIYMGEKSIKAIILK